MPGSGPVVCFHSKQSNEAVYRSNNRRERTAKKQASKKETTAELTCQTVLIK